MAILAQNKESRPRLTSVSHQRPSSKKKILTRVLNLRDKIHSKEQSVSAITWSEGGKEEEIKTWKNEESILG